MPRPPAPPGVKHYDSFIGTYKPSRKTMRRLADLHDEIGIGPMKVISEMAKDGCSIAFIAKKLDLPQGTVRNLMAGKGIQPHSKPEIIDGGPRNESIKRGRRASGKDMVMVEGRRLLELMEERGHTHGSPMYKRVRRRLEWGMTFEQAYEDASRVK